MLTTAWLTIRRWVNEARVIEDQRLLGVWHSACKKASITSPPGLRDSQFCSTPLVVGTWSPTVLIPSSVLECLHDDELETVFIHELMHVRRHDASIRMAASLMGAIYFLLPWVWIANWRLRRLCEDACDETTVIALRGRRKSYGSAILKTAEIIGYEPPRFALGMRDSHRSPRQRLERLLDARLPLHPTSTLRTTCLLTVMALVLLPGGARPPLTRAADRGTDASASVAPIKPPIVLDPATTEARPPLKEEPIGPATDSTTTEPRQATDATTLSSRQLVVMFLDPLRRPGWIERLRKMPDAESVGASLLTHEHAEVRIAALLVLQATGTPQSLPGVEHAYLHGKTREQSAAKATLNAIWQRVRAELPQQKSIQNSVRIFD